METKEEPQGYPPDISIEAPPLETKEGILRVNNRYWITPASVEQHIMPLEARVAALEAENARLTEITNLLGKLAVMKYDTEQTCNRIAAQAMRQAKP